MTNHELKMPSKKIKCPYCGCSSLDTDIDCLLGDDGEADTVFRCKACGTRFALYLESIPENRARVQE